MRRERRQLPLNRSLKLGNSRNRQDDTAMTGFSLDSLKIKERQTQQQSTTTARTWTPIHVAFGMLIMVVIYHLPSVIKSSPSSIMKERSIRNPFTTWKRRKNPMLPKPGEYAPLRPNTILPLIKLWRAPTAEYHIFSISSEDDVALHVLTNLLMGLFDEPDEHLGIVMWSAQGDQYMTRHKNEWVANNVTVVSQTLDTDIIHLQREFRSSYRNLFFFVVDHGQPECQIPQQLIMMCIPQSDLLYHGLEQEKIVIERIIQRIHRELPYWSKVDFSRVLENAAHRLDCMAEMMLQMKENHVFEARQN